MRRTSGTMSSAYLPPGVSPFGLGWYGGRGMGARPSRYRRSDRNQPASTAGQVEQEPCVAEPGSDPCVTTTSSPRSSRSRSSRASSQRTKGWKKNGMRSNSWAGLVQSSYRARCTQLAQKAGATVPTRASRPSRPGRGQRGAGQQMTTGEKTAACDASRTGRDNPSHRPTLIDESPPTPRPTSTASRFNRARVSQPPRQPRATGRGRPTPRLQSS